MPSELVPAEEVARLARQFHDRLVQSMIESGEVNSQAYALVVYDLIDNEEVFSRVFHPADMVLEKDYLGRARAKLLICLQAGVDSGDAVQVAPESLTRGQMRFPGAVVVGPRFAVSISGFRGYDDNELATIFGHYLRRFAFAALAQIPDDQYFVGGEIDLGLAGYRIRDTDGYDDGVPVELILEGGR